jgi:hypothetical protein
LGRVSKSMKKVYRTDLGSLIFVGFGLLIIIGLFLFVFALSSLKVKILALAAIAFLSFLLFNLRKYEVIITDDAIHAKILAIAFLNKYQVMRFDEIVEVWNMVGPFSDMQNIVFKSRDPSKKRMSVSVGFGLPWQALLDILERLPKDTKVTFEPLLWKRIKHPPKPDTPKRLLITAVMLILIIATGFLYSWWNVFVRK